jgi:uncharacterized protein (TIGR03083 family)
MDTWELVDAERTDFADLADGLTAEQWDARTLCTQWKVRDIVAHVTQGATMGTGESIKKMFKYGFRLNKLLTEEAKKGGAAPVEQLRADLRATVGNRTKPPGVKPVATLADEVVHQQDIRRAIGVPRVVPQDRLVAVLDEIANNSNPLVPTKKRLAGLHLQATDLDWETGAPTGAEVRGSGEALMMAMSGRPAALGDVTGPGVEQLRERISR